MKPGTKKFLIFASIMMVGLAFIIVLVIPRIDRLFSHSETEGTKIGISQDMFQAKVLDIVETGTIMLGETLQTYQVLQVEVLEGPWKGEVLDIDYGKRQIRQGGYPLKTEDRILLQINEMPDGRVNAHFIDFVRGRSIFILVLAFIVFGILVGGWQGFRGILGLTLSLVVILEFIIPNILQGRDPTMVSILGGILLLGATLYLIYGWSLKTHAAALGLVFSLIFAGIMLWFFLNLTRITGYGNEDALFIIQQANTQIDLRGLVLAGMLIGTLGALDDLVITQASVVFELHATDSGLGFRSLYQKAMHVGQDHVAAMINTLFMAYAGAALPTLVLFSLSNQALLDLIHLEFVAQEIVRTLAGSLGLIAAAPIATFTACLISEFKRNPSRLRHSPAAPHAIEPLLEDAQPRDDTAQPGEDNHTHRIES